MVLKDSWYNTIKWLCVFFLPALAIFVRAVFAIWEIPYGEQISSTIVAFNAFLGALIGISSYNYKKQGGKGDGNNE